jgi:hypothetical protein
MPDTRFDAEPIGTVLRQFEVPMAQGQADTDGLPGCPNIPEELLSLAQGMRWS